MSKVRIYCPYFPYPFREAAWQVMFNQAMAIHSLGHQIEIVSWKTAPNEVQTRLQESQRLWPSGMRVTVFSKSGPVRGTTSQWCDLGLVPRGLPEASRPRRVLRTLLSELTPPEIHYYDPACDQRHLLEDVELEIYHYSFAYAWLRKRIRLGRKQVVHFHNLESDLFKLRAEQSKSILEASIHRLTQKKLFKNELRLSKICDEIWQHADQDLHEYQQRLGKPVKGRTVTPAISENLLKQRRMAQPPPMQKGPVLGFIGSLDFDPNFLSFKWILDQLGPGLQAKNFGGKLSQVGKASERARELAAPYPFVELKGFVDNVEDWWKNLSFLLVPDTTGAGIRLKILEAIGSGVPVIANQKAIGRLPLAVQQSPLIILKEDPAEWVEYIMAQVPLEYRASLAYLPMNEGIRGRSIYAFLSQINV